MYKRPCSLCSKELIYKRKDSFNRAEANGSICPSCRTSLNNKTRKPLKKEKNPAWAGYKDVPGKVFSKLKRDAEKRNIEFDITIEDIYARYIKQNKRCAFTGVILEFGLDASVDRIDSSEGYYRYNIQIVHKTMNMMKKDLPNDVFIAWCKMVK